ncbi:KAT8 regulatory NSL complex subunit 1-like protein [Gastrophryne carolinensis]
MQHLSPLNSSSSCLMYTGNVLCHQKDYKNSEADRSVSPPYQSVSLSSSGLNVEHSLLWKSEEEPHPQRYCPRKSSGTNFAGRKVKRKLFPGSVSQVLADVNKFWDLSVTEAEGMPGLPKYRLSGRIEGESLALRLASDYSVPEVMNLENQPKTITSKESDVKSIFQRCLNRQQALITRAQRNKKRLDVLLANHVVEHCSREIHDLLKDHINKTKENISPVFKSSDLETNHDALVTPRVDVHGGNLQNKGVIPIVQKFCLPMTEIINSVERDLDSDATGSSSDEDWEENSRKSNVCSSEWKWLSVRAHLASRWTWLQTQISELEYKIQHMAHLQSQIRRNKETLVFEEPSGRILQEQTYQLYPCSSFIPAERLATPRANVTPSPTKDLEMSPSSPTLLLRNIEKQSAQLTEMVSSLMSAFPNTFSPNPVRSFKNGNEATGFSYRYVNASRVCNAKASMHRSSQKCQPVKKRKRMCTKTNFSSIGSSARIRPLKLFHKRNLYKLGPGCRALYSHNAIYCDDQPLQTLNLRSNWTCCDKPQKPLLLKSNACEIDPNLHPVLSLTSDLPLYMHLEGLLKNNSTLNGDALDSPTYRHEDDHGSADLHMYYPDNVTQPCHNEHNEEKNDSIQNEFGSVAVNSFRNDAETENVTPTTPASQNSSISRRDSSVLDSAQRRRLRSESSYDIDNIVIPMNLVAPIKLEKLQYKEITTPSWKEMEYEPLENVLDEELEDLSDEAFSCRHEKYEQKEKARWSFWHHNKWPKKRRSSGTGFPIWPGGTFPSGEATCSPSCLSPVMHNLSSPNTNGHSDSHDKIEYWELRVFPLTEAADLAQKPNVIKARWYLTKTPPAHLQTEQSKVEDYNNGENLQLTI